MAARTRDPARPRHLHPDTLSPLQSGAVRRPSPQARDSPRHVRRCPVQSGPVPPGAPPSSPVHPAEIDRFLVLLTRRWVEAESRSVHQVSRTRASNSSPEIPFLSGDRRTATLELGLPLDRDLTAFDAGVQRRHVVTVARRRVSSGPPGDPNRQPIFGPYRIESGLALRRRWGRRWAFRQYPKDWGGGGEEGRGPEGGGEQAARPRDRAAVLPEGAQETVTGAASRTAAVVGGAAGVVACRP